MGDFKGHPFRGNQWSAAIARLDAAAVTGTSALGDKMATPLRFHEGMHPIAIGKMTYAEVPISKLLANQDEVYKGGVREKMKEIRRRGPEMLAPVRVVKSGGKLYLTDGHHRAAAAKLLGLKKIGADIQTDIDAPRRRR